MKILKFLIAASVSAMLLIPSPAQSKIRFGLKGGIDGAEMKLNSKLFSAENRLGFFLGPTLKFNLPLTGLGMDASLLYNHRSTRVVDSETENASSEKTLKSKRFILPVNLRYGFSFGESAEVFAFVGPQVGFHVGDNVQSLGEWKDEVAQWKLSSSNFSVNIGVGFSISHLQLTANYNVEVGRTGEVTFKDATSALADGFKGRYNSWQIAAAWFF